MEANLVIEERARQMRSVSSAIQVSETNLISDRPHLATLGFTTLN